MGKNIGFVYFLVAEEVKYFGSMIKYEGPLLILLLFIYGRPITWLQINCREKKRRIKNVHFLGFTFLSSFGWIEMSYSL